MKVILAKSAGFCWGVRRAVDKANTLARNPQQRVFTDGPLIHNQQMLDQLKAQGVHETSDPSSIPEGTLIIRAHGIPPGRRALLDKLAITVVDATCPDVAKIQKLIGQYARQGYAIIIFGDPGHAEVAGLMGYAEGKGFVVNDPDDIAGLPAMPLVCLVSQSTQLPLSYSRVADAVRTRFPSAVVLDTICKSTRNRQQELIEMAASVDAFVVVGDAHSANTLRLVELARSLKPTFHIETSSQLSPEKLRGFKVVGLTAGASTPAFIIDSVKAALEAIEQRES
jgi:4-hydroxy-3-methylbut-2-enyl diphosphate reductase